MQNSSEFSGLPLASMSRGYPLAQEFIVQGQPSTLDLQRVVNQLGGTTPRVLQTRQTLIFQEIPGNGNSGRIQGTVDQLYIPESWNNLVIGQAPVPMEFTSHNQLQNVLEQRTFKPVSPVSPVNKRIEGAAPSGILKQSEVRLPRIDAPSNIFLRTPEDKPLKKSLADGHRKHGNTIKFLEQQIDSPRFAPDEPSMIGGGKSQVKSLGPNSQIAKMNVSVHGPNHVSFYPENTQRSFKLVTSNNFLTVQTQKSFRNEFLSHYCSCCYSQNDCCSGEHCCDCWKICCAKCGQGCQCEKGCCNQLCDCGSNFWRHQIFKYRTSQAFMCCLACCSCGCCCYNGKCCHSRCCEESRCIKGCSNAQCACCDPFCRLKCCDCCYENVGHETVCCPCCDNCCRSDCECLRRCLQGNCSYLESCCQQKCTCFRPCCTKKCECKCFDCPCCQTGVCLWCRRNCCLICW